jgi:hypothetical protein
MRKNNLKAILKTAVRVVGILPLAAVVAFGAQQVNLTAGPTTTTMPDGTAVPMWGYSCGTAVGGSTATCAALNKSGAWSPVIITVPTGQDLTINLKNLLTFSNGNTVPTSLMIGESHSRLDRNYVVHGDFRDVYAAGTGAARAVVLHGSGGRSHHRTHLDGSPARHVPA